jgi:lipopolysaccharide assembly protein A
MRYVKVLLLTLFFFVSMIFFIQNNQVLSALLVLRLDILGLELVSREMPFYLIVLISFVIGSIFSLSYFLCEKLRLTKELKAAKAKLAALEQEVTSLRNLPLENETYSGMSREKSEDSLS